MHKFANLFSKSVFSREESIESLYAFFIPRLIFAPFTVASIARIGDHIFRVFLKHLQAHHGPDDSKVVVVNISCFCRSGRFYQMAGGTSAGSPGLRRIVVLCMDPDGPGIGKLFIFAMAGEAEVVIMIGFGQLGSTRPSMGIMTIKAEDPGIKMATLLEVEPLLMMGFGMGLGISPDARLKLIIVGERLSQWIGFVVLIIPGVFKCSIRNAHPSRMALAANLQASFVRQFPGVDDLPFGLGRPYMFGARTMAFFASRIEFHIFRFVALANLF